MGCSVRSGDFVYGGGECLLCLLGRESLTRLVRGLGASVDARAAAPQIFRNTQPSVAHWRFSLKEDLRLLQFKIKEKYIPQFLLWIESNL